MGFSDEYDIDCGSIASKSYKSERERELDELRLKGLAKTRRTKLKGCKLIRCMTKQGTCGARFQNLQKITIGWILVVSVFLTAIPISCFQSALL